MTEIIKNPREHETQLERGDFDIAEFDNSGNTPKDDLSFTKRELDRVKAYFYFLDDYSNSLGRSSMDDFLKREVLTEGVTDAGEGLLREEESRAKFVTNLGIAAALASDQNTSEDFLNKATGLFLISENASAEGLSFRTHLDTEDIGVEYISAMDKASSKLKGTERLEAKILLTAMMAAVSPEDQRNELLAGLIEVTNPADLEI